MKKYLIDDWTRQLAEKKLVEVDSKKLENPTIKPTISVVERLHKLKTKNVQLHREKMQREKIEKNLKEKDKILKETAAKLERERQLRRELENKLKDSDNKLEKVEEEVIEDTTEEILSQKNSPVNFTEGNTYIVFEQKPNKSVKYFKDQVGPNKKGLYITRDNPNTIIEKLKTENVQICWLSRIEAEKITTVSGLHDLSILISNFLEENPKSAVFLDGIEYLISNNDFQRVLKLIQQVRDKVTTNNSQLFIAVNAQTLTEQEKNLIGREGIIVK